jgi:hypothetical protein
MEHYCHAPSQASASPPSSPLTELYKGGLPSSEGAAGYATDVASGLQSFSFSPVSGSLNSPETSVAVFVPASAAPVILNTSPADDATNVVAGSNLVATFSEPVVAGTGNITLHLASDDSVVETFDVTSSSQLTFAGANVTIDPTSNLDPLSGYYVNIAGTAVKDTSGNTFAGLAGAAAWNFTTAAVHPPIVADNSGSFGGSAPGATVTDTIDVGVGADMLVVTTSSEFGSGTMSVTYVGVAMIRAVGNQTNSAIWYLDLATPGITGTLSVVATIPSSEASAGKLFGRLLATEN